MPDATPKRPEEGPAPEEDRRAGAPETAPDGTPATGFPEPAGQDPGDRSSDPSPHHALNNPADEPDPTEWPDPYDRREDPRAPGDDAFGEQPHPPPGAISTGEPHPADDIEAGATEGPKRDKVDE